LGTSAGRIAHGGARIRPADRKALGECGGDIGRPQGGEFTIHVDVVVVLGGETAGGQHGAGEAHQGDPGGRRQDRGDQVERQHGDPEGRQPRRDRPHHRHPLGRKAKQGDRQRGRDVNDCKRIRRSN